MVYIELIWENYPRFIADKIIEQAHAKIDLLKTADMLTLRVVKIDLGTRPPMFDNFKVYRKEVDSFLMDADLYWDSDAMVGLEAGTVMNITAGINVSRLYLKVKCRIRAKLLRNADPFISHLTVLPGKT